MLSTVDPTHRYFHKSYSASGKELREDYEEPLSKQTVSLNMSLFEDLPFRNDKTKRKRVFKKDDKEKDRVKMTKKNFKELLAEKQ